MSRGLPFVISLLIALIILTIMMWWETSHFTPKTQERSPVPTQSQTKPAASSGPTASESLLMGYGDANTPPIEDLRKIHRVTTGYFSVIKESSRFPIGGNEDLAAVLRGENPNREVFVHEGHAVFGSDGQLKDRWGSPLIVHPQAWRQLELRSAGPDKKPYTEDDLILLPSGLQPENR